MTPLVYQTLDRLQQTRSAPFCAYVYDLSALRAHIAAMRAALPAQCELFYAAKANPEKAILHTLAPWVDGFEAASGGELRWLRDQVPDSPLIFGGPGKLPAELETAVELEIDAIHVESLTELRRLSDIATRRQRPVRVMLRMNIPLTGIDGTRLMMGGKPTPFGLDAAELPLAIAAIDACRWLSLTGFHFHLMSHQLAVENHLALMRLYLRQVARWCEQFDVQIQQVNVGGGIGINYRDPTAHFDWATFCRRLPAVISECQAGHLKLRFECGRYISAGCGYYVMEVLDIKRNLGEWFAIGHGGTHHFRTPAAQGHNHPFSVLRREQHAPAVENQPVTLVGQLCTPKDVLARQQPVAALAIGDWLVFSLAGAYAWNISHQNFLMHAPPEVLWLE
ncbi:MULTISPECIES: type III PLP-dependent enzyme [unclassified Brenneria]|uniref:type III PLP-dependent enzyme n=1 Tax=unclassified Brenneria TaxID=2634434 RepID=UPI0018F08C02|nr:type III PLP-dependent enzyme [Brenneria sp. L3-3C-1]MBJ7223944.1 type III PLP-dependent enzyme [Brenneria sp. L3-3C-1]MEE3645188.1 type III PLP-dependent enzyme [Brenneria sp. L3_3C_1]